MAEQLKDSMSSEVHINKALRHSHRCQQTKGAAELSNKIIPFISDLQAKAQASSQARLSQDNSFDDLVFNASALDDRIRSISSAAKQYDRDHPGRRVHDLLFPERGYTKLLRLSYLKKADAAEEIKQRISSLGEEHPLAAHITALQESITNVRNAFAALQQEKTKVRTAVANEEIAQAKLREQYEFNYLDAIKMFGKTFANRLFPKLSSPKKIEELHEETSA